MEMPCGDPNFTPGILSAGSNGGFFMQNMKMIGDGMEWMTAVIF